MADNDRKSLIVSVLALAVSIVSPIASYLWLNQVERDNRDKSQLYCWIDHETFSIDTSVQQRRTEFDIEIRKEGVLKVDNVEIVLQTNRPDLSVNRVSVQSILGFERPVVNSGTIRLKLTSALGPTTAADNHRVSAHILISAIAASAFLPNPICLVTGAWLNSEVATAAPVGLSGGGSGGSF